MVAMVVEKVTDKIVENPVTDNVIEYARQVWLAGLGAFAKAEREGGKLFEALVERGEAVEEQARQKADEVVEDLKERLDEVRHKAAKNWNNLEKAFQKRVARALHRLGVPSREDIQNLARQVNELQASIKAMIDAEQAGLPKKAHIRSVGEAA